MKAHQGTRLVFIVQFHVYFGQYSSTRETHYEFSAKSFLYDSSLWATCARSSSHDFKSLPNKVLFTKADYKLTRLLSTKRFLIISVLNLSRGSSCRVDRALEKLLVLHTKEIVYSFGKLAIGCAGMAFRIFLNFFPSRRFPLTGLRPLMRIFFKVAMIDWTSCSGLCILYFQA